METPLNAILNLLADGQWHALNEISAQKPFLKFPLTDLAQLLNFLAEYDFIELEERLDHFISVKLTRPVQEFMKKILWIERALGTCKQTLKLNKDYSFRESRWLTGKR